MTIESRIDGLYQQPLAEFTAARTALAKELSGAEAARVRKLKKPTLVPWAVNQVYWRARPVFDRLRTTGARLRQTQISALKGRAADVREAADAHRRAIAEAVAAAERLAAAADSHPSPDVLMRTFEALSLAPESPEHPGRLTEPLQPAGFEALAGVTPQPPAHRPFAKGRVSEAAEKKAREAEKARERERTQALKQADAAVARAEAREQLARRAWERAKAEVATAREARDRL